MLFTTPAQTRHLRLKPVTWSTSISLRMSVLCTAGTASYGGGIYIEGGSLTLNRTGISNNMAPKGGGIYAKAVTGGITVQGSTLSTNEAKQIAQAASVKTMTPEMAVEKSLPYAWFRSKNLGEALSLIHI